MKDKPFQLWLSSQDSVPHDTSCSALKLAASFIREKIQHLRSSGWPVLGWIEAEHLSCNILSRMRARVSSG